MPAITTPEDIELIIEDIGGGGGSRPPVRSSDGGGDDDEGKTRRPSPPAARRYRAAIGIAMVSISIFFLVIVAVFIARWHSVGWIPARVPAILWVNTVVLLTSSFTLELARRRLARGELRQFRLLWMLTTALGFLFVAGQVWAWAQLISQGVFIASTLGSSFFYVFTGLHALHLLGGLVALSHIMVRSSSPARVMQSVSVEIVGRYWHFMDGLWVFLLALLYFGK
jgi:cytochrome c oxidase subunit 3